MEETETTVAKEGVHTESRNKAEANNAGFFALRRIKHRLHFMNGSCLLCLFFP